MVCATEDGMATRRKKLNFIARKLTCPLRKDVFDAPFFKAITIARELELLPSLVLEVFGFPGGNEDEPTAVVSRQFEVCRNIFRVIR